MIAPTSSTVTVVYQVECYCGTGEFIDSASYIEECAGYYSDEDEDQVQEKIYDYVYNSCVPVLEPEETTFARLSRILATMCASTATDPIQLKRIIERTPSDGGLAFVTVELEIPRTTVFSDSRCDIHAPEERTFDTTQFPFRLISYLPTYLEFSPLR